MSISLRRVMGVDPGVSGAVAIFDPSQSNRVHVHPLPTIKVQSGGKNRTRLQLDECWRMLSGLISIYEPAICVLEDVNGYSGNAASTGSASFVFGRATGNIEGMIVALAVARHYVGPGVWKKAYQLAGIKGLEAKKTASRVKAAQLFPESYESFQLKKQHGSAEAALLADYGYKYVLRNI